MRLIHGLYLAAGLAVAAFFGWRAVSFFPEAWKTFRERDLMAPSSVRIDSTLFEGDPSGNTDTTGVAQDTGLTALLTRLAPDLGIASRRMSVANTPAGDLPLYTMNFRIGIPLAERVQELSDSLAARGFRLDESSERPRAKYPWAARLHHDDRTVALLRGRSTSPPGPGTFRLHVGFWTDSLTVPDLANLEKFPSGVLLALQPADFATSQLSGISRIRGLDLAVLLRLESSLFPASRQEKTRVLLHHDPDGIARRILVNDSVARLAKGVVVMDGDRGARDPGLARRLADLMRDRSWWLLDATRTSASRLEDAAIEASLGILLPARRTETDPAASLELAALQAESDGESAVMLKLDSTSAAALATFVPLVGARGISIAPWPVTHRRSTGE
jgi:hypothetical protein